MPGWACLRVTTMLRVRIWPQPPRPWPVTLMRLRARRSPPRPCCSRCKARRVRWNCRVWTRPWRRSPQQRRGAEMRAALWLLALFAVAVASALFAGNNQGTVTLYWPPYRIDLSLNLVLVLLAVLFVTLHLALRALSGLLHIPVQAKRWRLLYKERAMHEALLDSLSNLVAGRFVRARKAAELVVTLEES